MDDKVPSPQPDRRDFLVKAAAVVAGGAALAVPVAGGMALLLDPLRRKAGEGLKVRITTLAALPEDGEPRKFGVLATRVDAWNRTPDVPVGAVYLRRVGDKIQALNVVCPHAGCFVEHSGGTGNFHCPCHNSSFDLEGKVADPKSPSPRGLDPLAVEVREDGEIWVEFRNYRAGVKERIPV